MKKQIISLFLLFAIALSQPIQATGRVQRSRSAQYSGVVAPRSAGSQLRLPQPSGAVAPRSAVRQLSVPRLPVSFLPPADTSAVSSAVTVVRAARPVAAVTRVAQPSGNGLFGCLRATANGIASAASKTGNAVVTVAQFPVKVANKTATTAHAVINRVNSIAAGVARTTTGAGRAIAAGAKTGGFTGAASGAVIGGISGAMAGGAGVIPGALAGAVLYGAQGAACGAFSGGAGALVSQENAALVGATTAVLVTLAVGGGAIGAGISSGANAITSASSSGVAVSCAKGLVHGTAAATANVIATAGRSIWSLAASPLCWAGLVSAPAGAVVSAPAAAAAFAAGAAAGSAGAESLHVPTASRTVGTVVPPRPSSSARWDLPPTFVGSRSALRRRVVPAPAVAGAEDVALLGF